MLVRDLSNLPLVALSGDKTNGIWHIKLDTLNNKYLILDENLSLINKSIFGR